MGSKLALSLFAATTLSVAVTITACIDAPDDARDRGEPDPIASAASEVRDRYIVVLAARPGLAATSARDLTARYGGRVRHDYGAALRGYAAEMTSEQARALAGDA